MQIYSYVLKTESGDLCHKILINKNYDNAIDFMKNEMDWEYDAWITEGYTDEEIPYNYFDKQQLEFLL